MSEFQKHGMFLSFGEVLSKIGKLNNWLFDQSQHIGEVKRIRRLNQFLGQKGEELTKRGQEDRFSILTSYAQTRSEYGRLLYESGQPRNHTTENPWVAQGGNQIETQYHKLRSEIEEQYPDLIEAVHRVDSLLPGF